MQDVVIVTDSATDIDHELADRLSIVVVPTHVVIGEEDYRDRVDLSPEEFYARLPTLTTLPSTSGGNVADFLEGYERALEMGKRIVCITIPSPLSVCLTSARSARELMLMDHPDADITVVDSHTCITPESLMVIAAAKAAQAGEGKEEILALAEGLIPKADAFLALQSIEYLDKGGRLTATEQVVGSLRDATPIVRVKDYRIMPVDKAETREKSIERVLTLMENEVGPGAEVVVGVAHGNVPDEAAEFSETLRARFSCSELHTFLLGPVAATHFGPGMLGAAFYPID